MGIDFPGDADGDVLRALVKEGVDLAKPRTVEFTIAAPDIDTARNLLERIAAAGYIPHLYVDEQDGSISLYCATDMVLTYEGVVERQAQLNSLCEPLGAACHGWLVEGCSAPAN